MARRCELQLLRLPTGATEPLRRCRLAKQHDLDVVMVTPKAEPPVVRLVEWSKVRRRWVWSWAG